MFIDQASIIDALEDLLKLLPQGLHGERFHNVAVDSERPETPQRSPRA